MVKKLSGIQKWHKVAPLPLIVNDSRRQMGLAAAAGTAQDQPPTGLSGKSLRRLIGTTELLLGSRVAAFTLRLQVVKGEAELPPKGATIGVGDSTVCDECPLARNVKMIKEFKRIQDIAPVDPTLCILEQGVPCNGPATRSGCNARCPQAGAQRIGCYGPAEGVMDYGARLMTAFASVIDANTPEEIDHILDGIPDPTGQVYRFNLAGSLLKANREAWKVK